MGRNRKCRGGGRLGPAGWAILAAALLLAILPASLPRTDEACAQESPRGPVVAEHAPILGFADWFQRGGVFMWPLLVCSVAGLAIIIERLIAVQRATTRNRSTIRRILRRLDRDGIDGAIEECSKDPEPVSRVLAAGLDRASGGVGRIERSLETAGSVEVAGLQRGLLWLATIANVAPLLGFLGTVSGMIHAFATIAGADQITVRLVASGIEEALITTEAGLVIAIPVQAMHNYFVSRIDRFITELEEGSMDLVTTLEGIAGFGDPARPGPLELP